jgi:cobalt-zinc-cadmium efflux system outer membrane protein
MPGLRARWTRCAAAAWLCLASAAASRGAEPPGPELALPARLTLPEALRIFRERGLDLLLAEAAVAGAEGDVRAAGAVPNPALSGSLGRSWSCGPGGCPGPAWGVGLSDQAALSDLLSGKRGLRVDVARAALAAVRLSRDDAERTLSFQVKQQFLAALVGRRALDYAREAQAATREMLQLSQARFRAGAVSEADVVRFDVQALEAEQGVDQALQALSQARVGLAFLLGARAAVPEFEVEAPELLRAAAPPRLAAATPEALLAEARELRPDLGAAARREERAAAAVTLARRQLWPEVALSLQYAQQGSGPAALTPPTGAVGLSLPLPVLYQQQGEVARAEAEQRAQAAARAKVEAQVVADVAGAHAAWAAAHRRAERMETRLLDRARLARDLVRIQYQKGAASLLDYLDAERTYIAVQVEYLDDLSTYWTAVFQLEEAVGTDLRP